MLYSILPEWLYSIISKNFIQDYIYEIRIRIGKPIMINYKGRFLAVNENKDYSNQVIIFYQWQQNNQYMLITIK